MFENNTYQVILERMLARIPNTFDKREGAMIYDALAPAAAELTMAYIGLEAVFREMFADTASKDCLIRRAAERGITPYSATHAILRGVFTPTSISIPTGARFHCNDTVYYVVEKISDGEYRMECEELGEAGNQTAGKLIPIDYIAGLETAELTEILIPGEDEEETEHLRKRYFDSLESQAFGGNIRDYLEKINAIPGVGGTKVTRVWNKNLRPAEMIPSVIVQAWYATVKPTLTGEVAAWLEIVYDAALNKKLTTGGTVRLTILSSDFEAASDTLIKTVQQTVDPNEYAGEGYGIAPIGHLVNVVSVEPVTIDLELELVYQTGYSFDGVKESIQNAVDAYFHELNQTWADNEVLVVRISRLEGRILELEGILDITETKLNGEAKNLVLGENEIAIRGDIHDAGS